jgi:hypothetical protein
LTRRSGSGALCASMPKLGKWRGRALRANPADSRTNKRQGRDKASTNCGDVAASSLTLSWLARSPTNAVMQVDNSPSVVAWIASVLLTMTVSCAGSGTSASNRLADHTAGKACLTDPDCSPGKCLQPLRGTAQGVTSAWQAPAGYCSADCSLDADCGADGICVFAASESSDSVSDAGARGQCMSRCAAASQCRMGYYCVDTNGKKLESTGSNDQPKATAPGSCQVVAPVNTLTGDSVGMMCASDNDCGGGDCSTVDVVFRPFPGGYCAGTCLRDSDCGEAGTCATASGLPGAPGTCFRKCTSDADCGRAQYRCRKNVLGTGLQCQPGARPLPDGTSGKACATDNDCGGAAMSCAARSIGGNSMLFPGGYCTLACADNSDCGAGAVCSPNLAVIAMGSCYKPARPSKIAATGMRAVCSLNPRSIGRAWSCPCPAQVYRYVPLG